MQHLILVHRDAAIDAIISRITVIQQPTNKGIKIGDTLELIEYDYLKKHRLSKTVYVTVTSVLNYSINGLLSGSSAVVFKYDHHTTLEDKKQNGK